MEEFQSHLRRVLQEAIAAARAQPPHPGRSFWAHRSHENFPPPCIRMPDEVDGSDRLSIACTQTELPAKAQRDLVHRWCEELPSMTQVRYLWFLSKVPQALFDAACRLPNLEGIYVKWSGIDSVEPLLQPAGLRYVHLGSSPAVTDIACLARLPELRWLELDNLKMISDLAPLAGLGKLEGLAFTGAEGRRHTVASLTPLSNLLELTWLHLGSLHVRDESLRPLAPLKKLRWLGLGKFFSWEEFAWLSAKLPDTDCLWCKPGEDFGRIGMKCKRCGEGIISLTGKGMGKLCPTCDVEKWQDFIAAFAAVVESAR